MTIANEPKSKEEVFIRADLERTGGGGVAYFRLDNNLMKFIDQCREKHEIEAIVFDIEDGKCGRNIGFALNKKNAT